MSELQPVEVYWKGLQPWLETSGYQLRPRYRVGWIPSWISSPCRNPMDTWMREDHLTLYYSRVMDATRIRDGKQVILKRIANVAGNEKEIAWHLASPPASEDTNNHCLPVEEVLDIPGEDQCQIIVMRMLRPFDSPRFDTIGECVDFFLQAFKGLQFIHHRNVAHRDCTAPNLMMEASKMYPEGFHPLFPDENRDYTGPAKHFTRTQHPPTYFWIDFGLSIRFDESDSSRKVIVLHANDRTVPEFQDEEHLTRLYDPFPVDIYYLGNLIREYFLEGHEDYEAKLGLDFMKPLVEDMVQDDPAKRPTIDECVDRLDEIVRSLSSWKLRSQVVYSTDNIFGYIYRFFPHWFRRISYIIRGIPPIPVRKNDTLYPFASAA